MKLAGCLGDRPRPRVDGVFDGGVNDAVFLGAAAVVPLMLVLLDKPPNAAQHVKNPSANAIPMAIVCSLFGFLSTVPPG